MTITTGRLALVPGTEAMVRAEIGSRADFVRLLGASVPDNWPPDTVADALPVFLAELESRPDHAGWWCWYALAPDSFAGGRVLVGGGGFMGPPKDGSAELGYSVMPEFQRQGFATEIVRGLVGWAFAHPEVDRIVAETEWANPASVRVLEKAGFARIEDGPEDGGARFELVREE